MSTDTPEPFLTLAADGEANLRVRASRFMAIAFPVADEEEARRRLLDRSGAYHDASHHCAAWRFRNGAWRALDAGEPLVLAATDPAQPYGAALPWPASSGRPARAAGAFVVSRAGRPLAFLERGADDVLRRLRTETALPSPQPE